MDRCVTVVQRLVRSDDCDCGDAVAYVRRSVADFHGNDHRFQLKAINDFTLGDHHRSEATLAF